MRDVVARFTLFRERSYLATGRIGLGRELRSVESKSLHRV